MKTIKIALFSFLLFAGYSANAQEPQTKQNQSTLAEPKKASSTEQEQPKTGESSELKVEQKQELRLMHTAPVRRSESPAAEPKQVEAPKN